MNVTAIHRVTEEGEKSVALAVEYEKEIGGASLLKDSYHIPGRIITKVYANGEPYLCEGDAPAGGWYAIVELEHGGDSTKTLPMEWDVRGRKTLDLEVRQIKEISFADGTPCPPWPDAVPATGEVNREFDRFTPGTFEDGENGNVISYALHTPRNVSPGEKFPLVLYWHGGGEKGSNNLKSMLYTMNGVIWASEGEQRKHPCYVLVPQCPIDQHWLDPDTYETTGVFETACRLFLSVLERYDVDLTRVYCTGFSMGGMGAWESSKRYAKLIAGTLIMAGQNNYEGIEVLKDNMVWVFNSEDDDKAMPGNVDIVETLENAGAKVNRARWDGSLRGQDAAVQALDQLAKGGNILHSQYREGTVKGFWIHEFGWRPAITNEAVRDWLFSQRREGYSLEPYHYTTPAEYVPVKVDPGFDGKRVSRIAAGSRHNVALMEDGTVYAWGFNCSGQLGNGSCGPHSEQTSASPVEGLRDIVQVAAGNNFSLALSREGKLYGWGSNAYGQLAREDREDRFLKPVEIIFPGNIRKIDGGDNYALALREDGTLWSWGANINGQLGIGTFRSSGTPRQVKNPEGEEGFLSDIVDVTAGIRTVMALRSDGTVYCWGDGEYGQLGKGFAKHGPGTNLPFKSLDRSEPTGFLSGVKGMAEGRCFSAVLKKDGAVHAWGLSLHGELGIGEYKPEADPNDPDFSHDFVDTIVHPMKVESLCDVVKITAGMNHTLALLRDGSVYSWGYNKLMNSGVLGLGRSDMSRIPRQIEELRNIKDIFTGLNHNFALEDDGTLWAWGNGNNGRLGSKKGDI